MKRVRPTWQLKDARARFAELFRRAHSEGPQWITGRGDESVVVLAGEEFGRLSRRARQTDSLAEFFARSPLVNSGINLERDADRDG